MHRRGCGWACLTSCSCDPPHLHGEAPAALPPELGTLLPTPVVCGVLTALRGGVSLLRLFAVSPVHFPWVLGEHLCQTLLSRASGPAHFCLSSLPADLNYLLCGSQPAPHQHNAVQAPLPTVSGTAGPRAPRTPTVLSHLFGLQP